MKRATESKRGPGRPKLPAGEERTLVAFRADPNTLGMLDALAGAWGLDRSATIRRALEEALGVAFNATPAVEEVSAKFAEIRAGGGMNSSPARTLALVRQLEQPGQGMTVIPAVVAALEFSGATRAEAFDAIMALHRAKLVELRPESGLGIFSDDMLARCPPGPQGTALGWARILEGGR